MTGVVEAPAAEATEPGTRPGAVQLARSLARRYRFGLIAGLCYLLAALWVYRRLWVHPNLRLIGDGQDHQLFVWMLGHAARSVTHLTNPLFSAQLNVPNGVNLMANTSVLGLGIPMVPVTLLFGAQVSFAVLALVSLAATAGAWYYLFATRLVGSRLAALLGGALCGFGPGMIAHAPGHLHIIAQFLLPFIVLYVLKLAEPEHAVRHGVILGLLVTYQVFISEEMLLLTALGCGVFVLVYAALRWPRARAALPSTVKGLVAAGVVAGVLLAYPLWFQFLGPQHSRGLPFTASDFYADAWSYLTYPGQSVAGDPVAAVRLAANYGEENAYFGWPLLIVLTVGVVWLWRSLAVRLLAITGLIFAILSLGNELVIHTKHTGIPLPFRLVSKLPVFDMALPTRLSFVVLPVLGGLLALLADRVLAAIRAAEGNGLPLRLLAIGTAAAMLVPIAPMPLPAFDPAVTPAFITSGRWRAYVPDGRTLVPVPLPQNDAMTGMRWSAQTNLDLAIPRGFFIGPDGTAQRRGVFFAPLRPTVTLLQAVAKTGTVPAITPTDRANLLADLRYWRAAVVVLTTPTRHATQLRATLDALLGPAQLIDGATVWDVRNLVG
jgi:hypothetical protein